MKTMIELLNGTSLTWWTHVVHATWQAALVGGILLAVTFAGRRWPAPLRYGLLLLALFKFAFPPLVSIPTGLFTAVGPAFTIPEKHPAVPVPPKPRIALPMPPTSPNTRFATTEFGDQIDPPPASDWNSAFAKTSETVPALGWKGWFMLLHAAGCLVVITWIVRQLTQLRRITRQAQPAKGGQLSEQFADVSSKLGLRRQPRLMISAQVHAPIAFGLLRPTVMLPVSVIEKLSPAEIRTILAHELAHYRRSDLWINWLQLILLAGWWFNPVLWLLNRTIRKVREDCCDDLLLARGLTSSDAYCDVLIRAAAQLSRRVPAGLTLGFADDIHPLGRRVARIMDRTIRRYHKVSALGVLLLLALGGLLLPGLKSQTAERVSQPTPAPSPVSAVRAGSALEPASAEGVSASEGAGKTQVATFKGAGEHFDQLTLDFIRNSRMQARLREEFSKRGAEAIAFLTNELQNVNQPSRTEAIDRRKKAAWLLGEMKPATPAAISALIKALEDEDSDVGRWAAMALRDIGAPALEAIPALVEAMKFRNIAAGQALAKIAPNSESVAQTLIAVFTDSNQSINLREQLTYALADLQVRRVEVEAALVAAADSAEPHFLNSIAGVLSRIGPQTPAGRAILQAAQAGWRKERPDVNSASPDKIKDLIESVRAPNSRFADLTAINTLASLGKAAQAAVPVLVEYLETSTNQSRSSAANALGRIGPGAKDAVPALIAALNSDDRGLRIHSVFALGEMDQAAHQAIPTVTEMLREPDDVVRFVAARALRRIEPQLSQEVLPIFLTLAKTKFSENSFHPILAREFGKIGPKAKAALPVLATWLTNSRAALRVAAAEGLWRIDSGQADRVVPVLAASLKEEFSPVRREAVVLLGDLGIAAKAAVPALKECLNDEDQEIRAAAAEALKRIESSR